MKTKRFPEAAIFSIALALIFSGCSGDDGDSGGGDTPAFLGGELDGGSGLCAGFAEGTTREHYGKQKKQFCDERDGKKYVYVTIGDQTWMAENLNHETEGSVCAGNDPDNCAKYGRLYDWYDALTACPAGWHFASKDEWEELKTFVVEDINSWPSRSSSALLFMAFDSGTDNYGFSALPGGAKFPDGRDFNVGKIAYFWTASEGSLWAGDPNDSTKANQFAIGDMLVNFWYSNSEKTGKESVRCLKDVAEEFVDNAPKCEGNPQGYDPELYECRIGKNGVYLKGGLEDKSGNKYEAVLIGGKTWMASDLNYDAPGSKPGPYGKLYDWVTAMNIDPVYSNTIYPDVSLKHQGICPDGWHVPSERDWNVLLLYAADSATGEYAAFRLRAAFEGWDYKPVAFDDEYGFAALPGVTGMVGDDDIWWSTKQTDWIPDGDPSTEVVTLGIRPNIRNSVGSQRQPKSNFLSIRCLKD
jgi:uncharacterized protein (TIGR02145 family)